MRMLYLVFVLKARFGLATVRRPVIMVGLPITDSIIIIVAIGRAPNHMCGVPKA